MLLTMTDNDPVVLKEGAVKFKEGKKWKNRWAVLSRQSPVADKCTMDFKKQPKHEKKGEPMSETIKKSFFLENYVGILAGQEIDGIQYTLVIVLMKNLITLGFTTKYAMRDWELKIRQVFGEEEQFVVKIPNKPFLMKIKNSDRKMNGGITANLCLTSTQFALTTMKPPIKNIGVWNLRDVTAYGAGDGGFGFECLVKGRKTLFRLETSDGAAIENAFDVQTGADTEFTRSRFAPAHMQFNSNSGLAEPTRPTYPIQDSSSQQICHIGSLQSPNATATPFMTQHRPLYASKAGYFRDPPVQHSSIQQTPAGWSPNITTTNCSSSSLIGPGGAGGRKAHKEMYAPKPSCSDDHSPPNLASMAGMDYSREDDDVISSNEDDSTGGRNNSFSMHSASASYVKQAHPSVNSDSLVTPSLLQASFRLPERSLLPAPIAPPTDPTGTRSRRGSVNNEYADLHFPQPPPPIARRQGSQNKLATPAPAVPIRHTPKISTSPTPTQIAECIRLRLASSWTKCDCGANLNRSCPNLAREACKQRKCMRKSAMKRPNGNLKDGQFSVKGLALKVDGTLSSQYSAYKRWGSDQHVQYLDTYESQFEEALEMCGCDLDQAFSQQDPNSEGQMFNLHLLTEFRKSIRERVQDPSRRASNNNSGTITADSSSTPSTSKHSTPMHGPCKTSTSSRLGEVAACGDMNEMFVGESFRNGPIYVNIHCADRHRPETNSNSEPLLSNGSSPSEVSVQAVAMSTIASKSALSSSIPRRSKTSSSNNSNQFETHSQPNTLHSTMAQYGGSIENNNNSFTFSNHDHHYSQIDKVRHALAEENRSSLNNSSDIDPISLEASRVNGYGHPSRHKHSLTHSVTGASPSPTSTYMIRSVPNGNYHKLVSSDAKLSKANLDFLPTPSFASSTSNSYQRRQGNTSNGDVLHSNESSYPYKGASYGSRDVSPDPDQLSQNLSDSRDEVFVDDADYPDNVGARDVEAKVRIRNGSALSYDDEANFAGSTNKELHHHRPRKKSASKTTDRPRNGKDYGIPRNLGHRNLTTDSIGYYSSLNTPHNNGAGEPYRQLRRNSVKHEYVNAECIDNIFQVKREGNLPNSCDSILGLGQRKAPYENVAFPGVPSRQKRSVPANADSIYHSINYTGNKRRVETNSQRSGRSDEFVISQPQQGKVHLNYIEFSSTENSAIQVRHQAINRSLEKGNQGANRSPSGTVKPSPNLRTVQYCAIDVESTNILHKCYDEHIKSRKETYDRNHRPPVSNNVSNRTAENRHNSNSSAGSAGSLTRHGFR